jgi:hypothetical protein
MKKLLPLFLVVLLVALAVPALAQTVSTNPTDCNVTFDVFVDKDVTIRQNVYIDKDLDLKVNTWADPDEWAQCEVYKCDKNAGNKVFEIFDPKLVDKDLNVNTIEGSFNTFTGIGQANQAAGSMNNQGNVVAIAATSSDTARDALGKTRESEGLSHTQVAVEQVNSYNEMASILVTHLDTISGSFNTFTGIGQANQASGFMNNQNNVVAISANLEGPGVVALNDTFLTQSNTNNQAAFVAVNYQASINGSFNTFTGIGQVNQSPGSMNNQANIVSVAFAGASK